MASSGAPRAIPISPIRSKSPPSSPTSSSTTPPSRPRCCTTPSRTPRRPAPRSTACSADDIGALVEGLTKLKKLDLVTKEAKQAENLRKLLAGDRRRRARAAGQARRPPAQHAHARLHAGGSAPARRRGDAGNLCAARRPHGHARDARGARGPGVPRALSGSLRGGERAAQCARRPQPASRSPRSSSSSPRSSPTAASRRRCRGGASAPIRSGARWSASRSASSSCRTFSASASS